MEKDCPINNIMSVLSKKWTLIILYELNSNGRRRFNELIKGANGISARTLSKRLKELEKIDIIKRESFREIPPRVEYSLSSSGKKLVECFSYLGKWAEKWKNKGKKLI